MQQREKKKKGKEIYRYNNQHLFLKYQVNWNEEDMKNIADR